MAKDRGRTGDWLKNWMGRSVINANTKSFFMGRYGPDFYTDKD